MTCRTRTLGIVFTDVPDLTGDEADVYNWVATYQLEYWRTLTTNTVSPAFEPHRLRDVQATMERIVRNNTENGQGSAGCSRRGSSTSPSTGTPRRATTCDDFSDGTFADPDGTYTPKRRGSKTDHKMLHLSDGHRGPLDRHGQRRWRGRAEPGEARPSAALLVLPSRRTRRGARRRSRFRQRGPGGVGVGDASAPGGSVSVVVSASGQRSGGGSFETRVRTSAPVTCWYGRGMSGLEYFEYWKPGGPARQADTLDKYAAQGCCTRTTSRMPMTRRGTGTRRRVTSMRRRR